MPDGLQSYNVPPAGAPPPGLMPTQFTAPANYQADTAPPQYSSPSLPAPINYAPQTTQQPSSVDPSALPPGSHPPPYMAVLSAAEKSLGRPLTPDEFDKLTNDYKTNYAVPALNSQFKGKKANVEAEVASFDNQVQHLRQQRYGDAQDQAAKDTGVLGAFGLGAKGGLEKGVAGIGVLASSIADAFGLAPNKVADYLRSQANPNLNSDAAIQVKQLESMRDNLIAKWPKDEAKIRADLDPKIAVLTDTAKTPNLISNANTNLATASQAHPYAAFAGNLAGQLAPFLLTRGAGTLATATGEAIGNTGANAAQQLSEGQNLGTVQTQAAVDAPLETLAAFLPAHFNGKLLTRALKGAAVGGGANLAQQTADVGINSNNKFDPMSAGASTALAALIAAIPGAHADTSMFGKKPLKRPAAGEPASATGTAPETPPANAGAGTVTPNADGSYTVTTTAGETRLTGANAKRQAETLAATIQDGAKPASTPIDFYKIMIDTAPAEGIEQPAFIKLQASALEKANAQAKKYKTEIQNANTPEKVVQGAWALAQRFTGKQWDNLNAPQREQTVETLSAWLAKKSKVDMESVGQHLQTLREPPAPEGSTPPITEHPLPADITGQQAPGTVAQDKLDGQQPTAPTETPSYVGKPEYDSVWKQVTDENIPGDKLPTSAKILRDAIDTGKITSREQFDNILAQAAKTKGNALKAKAKAPTPSAETAKKAVADTVTEALTDKSTVESQKNKLKAGVKKQTEAQYNKGYFHALMNREKAAGSPEEAQLRNDPNFVAASEAMRQGKITSPEDVGRFLSSKKGTTTVGDTLAGHESKQVGALLGSKSTKSEIVQARKAVRTNVVEPLVKLGEDRAAINKMTVAEASAHLQRLADTFTSSESTVTPKKTLKKGANVEPVENPDQPPPKPKGGLKKRKTPSPKAEAPATKEAGATTPLDAKLRARLSNKLPQHSIDELHNAVSRAQVGDKGDLTDLIAGWTEINDLSQSDAKWLRALGKQEPLNDEYYNNNASGESKASLEAQRRIADEKAAGQTRAIIRRDGSVEPLIGVDAVDTHARAGEVVVQRGVGKNEWTILSHGDDISRPIAEGKINRAREELNSTHEATRKPTLEEVTSLNDERTKLNKGTEKELDKITPVQTKRRIQGIVNKIREGADVRETGKELQALHDDMEKVKMERKMRDAFRPLQRGTEYVRARLQKMISEHPEGDDHYEAGKLGLWLLDKNPNLGNYLAIRIHALGADGPSGRFSPVSRLVHINSTDTNPGTVVHEILHSAEQLMPDDLQARLRGEYIGRLQNKIKQVAKSGNKMGERYLQLALEDYVHPSEQARKEMSLLLRTQGKHIPYDEFYKYTNPSEYFAVEGTNILNRRYLADSWIAKIKEWLGGYVQHLKGALGLDSNSAVIKAVNESLKTRGEDYNSKMLLTPRKGGQETRTVNDERAAQDGEAPTDEELGYEAAPDNEDPNLQEKPPKKPNAVNLDKVTTAQHAIEQSMSADYGLEKAMQQLRAKGIEVNEHNNVEDAAYTKNGLVSEYNSKDFDEAFSPVDDLVTQIYSDHAKTKQEFVDKLNKFYQNTHFMERAKTDWAMESPLEGTAGFDRADLLEQVSNNEIDPVKAAKELDTLARKHASMTWQEWAEHNKVPLETMQKELDKLDKESGINQKSMEKLNKLMDGARERTTQRLELAGLVDKADPWKAFYGWKWYVPLKGSAYGGGPDNNFDLIPTKRIALSVLNKQLQVMEGRHSFADKPFTRLFVDMARAGERQGNSHVLDKVYNLAVDHGKAIGAHIDTFTGRPKDGYTNTKTGDKVDRLKAPASGVIINDGDTHYVVTLPKNSQLLRGLIQMNNVERPNALERKVAKGTNALARLYTTVHPGWQTFSGFVRDLTYIPVTLGATKYSNPFHALPLWKDYGGNVLQAYKALPTLIPHLLGKNNQLRAMGEADPQSWAGWTRRYEIAGGSNQFTKGFDTPSVERLFTSRLKDIDGVLDATKWGWAKTLEYTGNYANFLEAIGRVAMFKTLVERGMSESQAAVEVRKTLDYSKSGIKGRRINSWLAFFRVGMTGADAMRRAFTKPTGGLDFKKMAAWQGFMGALGAIGYMSATAMLGKDPDGKDRIAKVDTSQLTQKILFPLGDKVAGVNLGLGLPQVLMSPGILGAAYAMGHIKGGDAIQAYTDTLARNGPITPAGTKGHTPTDFLASYVLGFTPTVVRPLVDVERNTTVFNSPIHSDMGTNSKYPSDSGRTNTPEVFKEMAQWLADATDHKVDYAPEDIRYLIQSYGGQWATDIVKTATSNPDVAAGAPPTPNRMAGKLFVDTSHYMQNEMYDTLDQLQDSRRRYSSIVSRAKDDGASDEQAKAQADQIVSRDPQFKAEMQAYRALDNARKSYQQKVTAIRNNKLLSDTRKQLMRKQLDTQMRMAIEKAQTVLPKD
jgi:hypothetical protein